ncbi:MAG TPA: hypothetical protein VJ183_13535 [Chloroflexia bacterium]|nr:hypothetical protein [Chloroflexia bacterium]
MSGKDDRKNKGGDKQGKERTAAEWVTFGVSVLILLALVSLVIFQALTRGNRPSTIKIEPMLQAVRQSEGAYYLPISITNEGDEAVGDVEVQMSLESEGSEPETIAFTVQFLAGGESQEETVVFSKDPSQGELSHVVGFHVP